MDLYRKGLDFSPESFAIAKRRLCALRTEDTIKNFYKIFALMVKEGTWINAPINDRQIVYSRFRGGYYIAIYSSMDNRVAGDSKDVIATDINIVNGDHMPPCRDFVRGAVTVYVHPLGIVDNRLVEVEVNVLLCTLGEMLLGNGRNQFVSVTPRKYILRKEEGQRDGQC